AGMHESGALRDHEHSTAAGGEHYRGSGSRQTTHAATYGYSATVRASEHPHRPHQHDPGIGKGRGVRADADRGAGSDGDFSVPAEYLSHGHSERGRTAFPGRNVRSDVSAGLQPEQSHPDGVDNLHRIRGG